MNEPIRVCMVVNNLDVGGLERLVLSLLGSIDPSRFELSLACLKGEGKLFPQVELPRERCLVLPSDHVLDLKVVHVDPSTLVGLRRFLRDRRIDVVHTHNFGPLIYGGLAARSLLRRPRIVYSEHNQIHSASPRDLAKFAWYVRLADQVVAVSNDLERSLRQKLHIKRPVRVIHNGIDDRRFEGISGIAVRREFGIGDDEIVFGTAVVHSKQKGLTHLLSAARKVLDAVPRARFVIAGDGPLREDLVREARDAGLSDRVIFPGYRSDIPELLASFDVYVLPSLWEGLPLALLEALRLGKPIVCTTVGGNPEVIVDGVHGHLVPPADPEALAAALVKTANDEALFVRARTESPQRFREKFSLAAMTRKHEDLYRELVAGARRR